MTRLETPEDIMMHPIILALMALLGKCRFASFTYTSKKSGEVARYTLRLNTRYQAFLEKQILEAELKLQELPQEEQQSPKALALVEMKASFEKSLAYHIKGLQNPDYTKAGMYRDLGNGVRIFQDNTLEVAGVIHSYKVLVPGVHKPVTHRTPITAAKAELRKGFESWVTLSLDLGNLHEAKANGETAEID